MRKYNPRYVSIKRVQATPGEALHLIITVEAPTHYLNGPNDVIPKPCNEMSVHIVCRPGYPLVSIKAYYDKDHRLASFNVFASGDACIDTWIVFKSSLTTVVEKLVRDIIHDTNISRVESPAYSGLKKWYQEEKDAGRIPTFNPNLLFAPESAPLPPRRAARPVTTPPPLPGRKH